MGWLKSRGREDEAGRRRLLKRLRCDARSALRNDHASSLQAINPSQSKRLELSPFSSSLGLVKESVDLAVLFFGELQL